MPVHCYPRVQPPVAGRQESDSPVILPPAALGASPSTVTVPRSGARMPVRIRKRVVLPAPLRPLIEVTVPGHLEVDAAQHRRTSFPLPQDRQTPFSETSGSSDATTRRGLGGAVDVTVGGLGSASATSARSSGRRRPLLSRQTNAPARFILSVQHRAGSWEGWAERASSSEVALNDGQVRLVDRSGLALGVARISALPVKLLTRCMAGAAELSRKDLP